MPTLTSRQAVIIEALYDLNVALARGTENDRRALTRLMAEQFRFEFGPAYGCKASSPTNPQSKDAIAVQHDGRLYSWDWQNGDTRKPQVGVGAEAEDITGQYFIAVEPVNHLGVEPPPDDDESPDTHDLEARVVTLEQTVMVLGGDLKEAKQTVAALLLDVGDLKQQVVQLRDALAHLPPSTVKLGDPVTVAGSIGIREVLYGTKVTWKGKIGPQ